MKQSFYVLFIFLSHHLLWGYDAQVDTLWNLTFPIENVENTIHVNTADFSIAHIYQKPVLKKTGNSEQLGFQVGTIKTRLGIELFSLDVSAANIIIDSVLTFSWRWMIKDTELSDGIFILFGMDQNDWNLIGSHSTYTFPNTLICNEKSSVWNEHKVNLFRLINAAHSPDRFYLKKIQNITFYSMQAVDQEFWIDELTFSREPVEQADDVVNYRFTKNPYRIKEKLKPRSLCLNDVDRDGDLDMFLVNRAGPNYYLQNDGLGRFSEQHILTPDHVWNKSRHALFVDVNGDGWPDLFEARENNKNIFLYNDGNAHFSICKSYYDRSEPLTQTFNSLWGNFDANPALDFFEVSPSIIKTSQFKKKLRLNTNNDTSIHWLGWPSAYFGSAAADINNDGQLEIIVANNRGENILFNYDEQNGVRQWPDSIFKDIPFEDKALDEGFGASEGVVFFDFDHDGDPDMYICNDGEPNQLYVWDSHHFIEAAGQYNLDDSLASEGFLVADFDNDADWDVYILHHSGPNVLLKNNGNGYFTEATSGSGFEHPGGSTGGACGDIDNDGDIDIIVVDPVKGYQFLINPTNNNHFIKIKMRGEPGNYHGIRSKVHLYEAGQDTTRLLCYHQSTCGDGFQYEAMARDFHFGADPAAKYNIRVTFSDGKETELDNIRAGNTVMVLHPGSNFLIQAWRQWLYRVHEPALEWLRRKHVALAFFVVFIFGLLINFLKSYRIHNKVIKTLSGIAGLLLIFLLFRDLKTIHEGSLAALTFFSVFFTESFLNTLRILLHKHYVKEHSRDRLYDHLKAFRHGGMALKNMDRLVFLLQNYAGFSGNRDQYHAHINDAMTTYLNQTTWQISELNNMLSNLHWHYNDRREIAVCNLQLIRKFNNVQKNDKHQEWNDGTIRLIIDKIKRIQRTVEKIHRTISNHYLCEAAAIIKQVVNTRFPGQSITFHNEAGNKGDVVIKGYELGNIISDLIENGIRACNGAGSYNGRIRLREDGEYLVIDVTDNGCGIPKTIREEIFDKGFSRKKEGGGYGLYYGREVLARYSGKLLIHSTGKNQGTTMRVKLKKAKKET